LPNEEVNQVAQLGPSLQNILLAYGSDDSEGEEGYSSNTDIDEDLGSFEGVALAHPGVSHLQLFLCSSQS
jgi:hypothetical protein